MSAVQAVLTLPTSLCLQKQPRNNKPFQICVWAAAQQKSWAQEDKASSGWLCLSAAGIDPSAQTHSGRSSLSPAALEVCPMHRSKERKESGGWRILEEVLKRTPKGRLYGTYAVCVICVNLQLYIYTCGTSEERTGNT